MQELLIQISDHFRPIIQQEVRNALNEYKTRIEAPKDEKLYSRKETASKLKISLSTLTKYVRDGIIVAYRVSDGSKNRVLFKSEDITQCLFKIKTKGHSKDNFFNLATNFISIVLRKALLNSLTNPLSDFFSDCLHKITFINFMDLFF